MKTYTELKAFAPTPGGGAKNGVTETHEILGIPQWASYTFGSLFIVLGVVLLFFYKKTKANADEYRRRQLVEYKKQYPKSNATYEQTTMFLPAWEKAKMFAPVLFGIVFILLGISWLIGQSLFSV